MLEFAASVFVIACPPPACNMMTNYDSLPFNWVAADAGDGSVRCAPSDERNNLRNDCRFQQTNGGPEYFVADGGVQSIVQGVDAACFRATNFIIASQAAHSHYRRSCETEQSVISEA